MNRLLLLLLSITIVSCNTLNNQSTKKEKSLLSEYMFPISKDEIQFIESNSLESFAYAFKNTSEFNNGDTLKAKIFLANRHYVYKSDSLKPVIKILVDGCTEETDSEDLLQNGSPVKVINDTGYVKFIVRDDTIKKDQTVVKAWCASVTIPLKEMDTTFVLNFEYLIRNK